MLRSTRLRAVEVIAATLLICSLLALPRSRSSTRTKVWHSASPPVPVLAPLASHDREQCSQGPMAAGPPVCAFAEAQGHSTGMSAANCTVGSVLSRWHVTTQELLFVHLRSVWADDRPRVFMDLGSQAGHGLYRNMSDALLWLNYFNASGSLVIGVDAFEDYALDLQHRFDAVAPFSEMRGVSKLSLHAAVAAGKAEGAYTAAAAVVDLGESAAYTNFLCTRTDWMDDFNSFDRNGASDHICRITRQRGGVSASWLPLLPGSYAFSTDPTQSYPVRALPIDRIWREHAGGRFIDAMKIDVDRSFADLAPELLPLLAAGAIGVLVMEIDRNTGGRSWRVVEQINCLLWQNGYALFLKVPCAAADGRDAGSGIPQWSQRAAYLPLSGRRHTRLPTGWSRYSKASCAQGGKSKWGGDCATQDLIALNLRRRELAGIVALGNAACGSAYPADVTDDWTSAAAAATAAATSTAAELQPRVGSLVSERDRERMWLWGGPVRQKRARPANHSATMLADGTWSCGARTSPPKDRPSAAERAAAVGPLCR